MMIAFIVVLTLLLYTWGLYPALILLVGRKERRTHPRPLQGGEEDGRTHPRPLQGGEQERSPSPKAFPSSEGLGVGSFPPVTILFSAHNEEAVIRERLENLARLDYPPDKLHVWVGVDGGSDRTGAIASEWGTSHPNVHVLIESQNRGKMAMVKRLVDEVGRRHQATAECEAPGERGEYLHSTYPRVGRMSPSALPLQSPEADGDIRPTRECEGPRAAGALLVFTDANTMFMPEALRRLVAPFSDSKVGGVCGRLVFHNPRGQSSAGRSCGNIAEGAGTDEPTYWNLETRLKIAEGSLDSCLGANGAIYAIRAELFPAMIPDNTIIDDFVIGMKIREQGYRMVYEPGAVATEDLPATVQDEWRRRVRIGAGAYQAMSLCRACLSPRYGVFAWMFWSHKVLRWFTPHLLLIFLSLGIWLVAGGLTKPVLLALCCFSGGGVLGLAFRPCRKGLGLLAYFMTMQAALLAGFFRFCRGNLSGAWTRTGRGGKSEEPTPAPSREGRKKEEPTPDPSREGRKKEEPTPAPSKEGSGRETQDRRSSPPGRGRGGSIL